MRILSVIACLSFALIQPSFAQNKKAWLRSWIPITASICLMGRCWWLSSKVVYKGAFGLANQNGIFPIPPILNSWSVLFQSRLRPYWCWYRYRKDWWTLIKTFPITCRNFRRRTETALPYTSASQSQFGHAQLRYYEGFFPTNQPPEIYTREEYIKLYMDSATIIWTRLQLLIQQLGIFHTRLHYGKGYR